MKSEEEIRQEIKVLEESIKHPSMERWTDIKTKYIGMEEALKWVLDEEV